MLRCHLRRALRDERGYSLVELITVTVILSIVLGGLTTLFVSGANQELELNRRFQAQQAARLALDKLRREIHCASAVAPSGPSTSVTITLPSQCITGSGQFTWCALQDPTLPTGQFALYRQAGATCTTSGTKWAQFLTASSVFAYTVQSSQSLGSLAVDISVNPKPSVARETFQLQDRIVLRNSTRTCIAGSPTPPC